MVMLEYQSRTGASRQSHEGGEVLSKVAHELLTFVEKIVKFMRVARVKFEKNAGTPTYSILARAITNLSTHFDDPHSPIYLNF